jgi:hypothetical protein
VRKTRCASRPRAVGYSRSAAGLRFRSLEEPFAGFFPLGEGELHAGELVLRRAEPVDLVEEAGQVGAVVMPRCLVALAPLQTGSGPSPSALRAVSPRGVASAASSSARQAVACRAPQDRERSI